MAMTPIAARRPLERAERYSAAEIADVTGVAFRQAGERLRIDLLRALDGVSRPVASTLLHVGAGAEYPILDYRWSAAGGWPRRRA
jgi:hypothetical protein